MNRLYAWCRREWPTLFVIVAGIGIQAILVSRPFDFALNNLLVDDAFFYFKIAYNIATGIGSTFDGINATNGYHPLWLIVLVGIYKLFPISGMADTSPIHIALILQALMNVATAFLVARILTRFTQSVWIRGFGMIVWLLSPFMLYTTLNGLETPLALMLFALFFLLALRIEEGRAIGGYYFAGAVAGLMIVARLDMIFYLAAFFFWILARQGFRDGWKHVLQTGISAAPPVAAWFIWNFVNFGMLLTSASHAESLVNHQLIIQDHDSSWKQFFKAVVYLTQYELDHFFLRTGIYAFGCAAVGGFAALLLKGDIKIPQRVREMSLTLWMSAGFAMLFIADASVRWVAREWYFVSFQLFLAIIFVVLFDKLFPAITYKRTVGAVLLALILFSFYVFWSKTLRSDKNPINVQYQLLATADWMNENLPAGAIVGSFSPGIQGYFAEDIHLVDLDGLVNNSAVDAMRKQQLWQYIKDANIAYLWNYEQGMGYRYKSFLGIDDPFAHLTLVQSFYGDRPAGLHIYKVK